MLSLSHDLLPTSKIEGNESVDSQPSPSHSESVVESTQQPRGVIFLAAATVCTLHLLVARTLGSTEHTCLHECSQTLPVYLSQLTPFLGAVQNTDACAIITQGLLLSPSLYISSLSLERIGAYTLTYTLIESS